MNEEILELLCEILVIGRQQLVALEEKRTENIIKLDKKRQELIDRMKKMERDAPLTSHKDFSRNNLLPSGTERARMRKLVDNIVSVDTKLRKKIESHMEELTDAIGKIGKLKKAFCPSTFHRLPSKKINVNV